jgi:hypothetical protein
MSSPTLPNVTQFGTGLFGGPAVSTSGTFVVSDLLYMAHRKAGILMAPGRSYSIEEAVDGLLELNNMLNDWKAERLMVYSEDRQLFPINANQQTYLIGLGPGADYVVERPERIERAEFIFTNVTPNVEVPMKIFSPQEWTSLTPKLLTNTIVTSLYYEPLVLPSGNGKITLWPAPTQAWQIAIWIWITVNEFANTTDTVTLPPAYRSLIQNNLAVRLAAMYPGRSNIAPATVQLAAQLKSKIKGMNAPVLECQTEAAARGVNDKAGRHWSIFSNQYIG